MTGRRTLPSFDSILGLGSNLGDKVANIETAITLLETWGDLTIVERSRLYRTAPWGVTEQDWFVNAAVAIATELPVRALLTRCQEVEKRLGRVRAQRWGPRIIDIDILVYHQAVLKQPDLVVPHPRIGERAFVLAPLCDIAPDLEIGGRRVADCLRELGMYGVEPLDGG